MRCSTPIAPRSFVPSRASPCSTTLSTAFASCALRGLRVGLLTNGPATLQRQKIAVTQIKPDLDAIAISEEIGVAKPEPAAFHRAAALIGCPPAEVAMVGDSPHNDIAGALDAGTMCRPDLEDDVQLTVRQQSDESGELHQLLIRVVAPRSEREPCRAYPGRPDAPDHDSRSPKHRHDSYRRGLPKEISTRRLALASRRKLVRGVGGACRRGLRQTRVRT